MHRAVTTTTKPTPSRGFLSLNRHSNCHSSRSVFSPRFRRASTKFPQPVRQALGTNMASPTKIQLTGNERLAWAITPLRKDSAEKTSQLLQENHEKHNGYFNDMGFHNHIVHHLLTLYAMGADPETIQRGYDHNKTYQLPPTPLHQALVKDMRNPDQFKQYLGDRKHFHDYLIFFQEELETKGTDAVLNEYLFGGSEVAEDLFCRLLAGLLHPIIHLGFGIEFSQPAIIAEGLAQTATHDVWIKDFLLPAEKAAEEKEKQVGVEELNKTSLFDLLEEARKNEKIAKSANWEDSNRIRDGVLERAGKDMIDLASRWIVGSAKDLESKTAEMISAASYFTIASQRPPYVPKIDFFYLHSATSSLFYTTFLQKDGPAARFLTDATRIRLLEYKARMDLTVYVSRATPPLLLDEIANYAPRRPIAQQSDDNSGFWTAVCKRANAIDDDGHSAKLIRALANGAAATAKLPASAIGPSWKLGSQDLWRQSAMLALESVESGAGAGFLEGERATRAEPRWVRSTGFEQAWRDVPKRDEIGELAGKVGVAQL